MSDRAWRILLLVVCALAAVALCFQMHGRLRYAGTIDGLDQYVSQNFVGTEKPFLYRVADVVPRSTAERDGLHDGDLVDLRALSPQERFRWSVVLPYGARMTLRAEHGGQWRTLTFFVGRRQSMPWNSWVIFASKVWLLLFAALFAWRGAANAQARVLSLLSSLWVLAISTLASTTIEPWPELDFALGILGEVWWAMAFALFAAYAQLFARPSNTLRRALAIASYAAACCYALVGIAVHLGIWTAWFDPQAPFFGSWPVVLAWQVAPVFLPLLCVGAAVVAARGVERQRLVWAAASYGWIYLTTGIAGLWEIVSPNGYPPVWQDVMDVALFIAPLGFTYALLSRRLLDVAFVINRAAVFTTVSLFVVGIFVLVEWAVQEWVQTAGPAANIAVSAALALALGLSVRVIHTRVEHVLDNVFFRKRHEDQRAIRAFAREAAYITDEATLLERTRDVLQSRADASFVTVAVDDGAGRYGNVSENDPAIVALRAWHEVVDLHAVTSAFHGEFAYPMVARGRLVGALVLGPKHSGEAYAPDESESIAQLALGVGAALDMLSSTREDTLATLVEAIRALPDAIAHRLSETHM